ncbi:MAG TPA: aminodeoxychorismate synthase component I [Methylophilaceae bacterium]|nr:aminodeoxychorismate synthase component I [Methylophilaceae bacterium]HQR60968.1 aminodeoxychorismate synthase component I [Methylophilaceae bacterium]
MIAELPYRANGAELFGHIAQRPWAVYLDSGRPGSSYGRYDILAADPFITLVTRCGKTEIRQGEDVRISSEDPFMLLQRTLRQFPASAGELPFAGGAIGYFSYDLARRLEHLPDTAVDAEHMPEMAVGVYDWAVVLDHEQRRAWLVGQGFDARTQQRWDELRALFSASAVTQAETFKTTGLISSNMDMDTYAAAFRRVLDYIQAGDCYQVNLAQRFSTKAEGDAWTAYLQLRRISPAPFSAYLNTPAAQILSASPECFLKVRDGRVETKPIKGTRPRSLDLAQDLENADELRASLKDRAENLMIVDLLRNDIGKSCAVGSVKAERLFELESFANVHHLVSTVTGTLAEGRDAIDLLRGCFPGGSITGAPKLRAMQIIEELEPHRRGVYCGAIGYIGFDGNMDTSIAIRTAVYSGGSIRFWAGGGIVADSEMDKEYRETWDKASSMLQLMEQFHVGG